MFASYKFIEFVNLDGAVGWNIALGICRVGNLDADDSIHLASAIGSGCTVLLSSDSFLKKEGMRIIAGHNDVAKKDSSFKKISLEILTPEEVLSKLDKSKKVK